MSNKDLPTLTIGLNIARVDSGGNAGQGKYFFSFDIDPIVITTATMMTFQLGEDTPSSIYVTGVATSDALSQLETQPIEPGSRYVNVYNKGSVEYLMQVAILVYDSKFNTNFVCDPQVVNTPDPT
jgi:hypothetical protein